MDSIDHLRPLDRAVLTLERAFSTDPMFKVVGTAMLGPGGPLAWAMRREPPGVLPPAQIRIAPPG